MNETEVEPKSPTTNAQPLRSILEDAPMQIRNAEFLLLSRKAVVAQHETALRLIELRMTREVTQELGPDRKPRFPNEQSRNAEISARLQELVVWVQRQAEVEKAREDLEEAQVEAEFQRNQFRSARSLAQIEAAEVEA